MNNNPTLEPFPLTITEYIDGELGEYITKYEKRINELAEQIGQYASVLDTPPSSRPASSMEVKPGETVTVPWGTKIPDLAPRPGMYTVTTHPVTIATPAESLADEIKRIMDKCEINFEQAWKIWKEANARA